MKWYQLEIPAVLEECKTSPEGLTTSEIEERLKQYGPNSLPEEAGLSRLKVLLHQFKSPLIYILIVAAIVTALLAEYIDTGVIVVILVINAIVGYFQEYRAETSVRALKKMVVPRARVIRDGREKEVASEGLVPGDIVLLPPVPRSLRIYGFSTSRN